MMQNKTSSRFALHATQSRIEDPPASGDGSDVGMRASRALDRKPLQHAITMNAC
jgi:hypothetical protein